MPSSLAKSHSRALAFSAHPPVSVYGTVNDGQFYEGFLGSVVGQLQAVSHPGLGFRINAPPDLPGRALLRPFPGTSITRYAYPSASPLSDTIVGSGILTGCPSPTPFGLGLGPTNPELTNIVQGTLRFSATRILTLFLATYSGILTS